MSNELEKLAIVRGLGLQVMDKGVREQLISVNYNDNEEKEDCYISVRLSRW